VPFKVNMVKIEFGSLVNSKEPAPVMLLLIKAVFPLPSMIPVTPPLIVIGFVSKLSSSFSVDVPVNVIIVGGVVGRDRSLIASVPD
jgi:hypothetical protein